MVVSPGTPWFDSTILKGKGAVRDDKVRVNIDDPAKPSACLTCSYRAVKGEEVWNWPLIDYFAHCTLDPIAEGKVSVRFYPQIQGASSKTEGLLEGVENPLPVRMP